MLNPVNSALIAGYNQLANAAMHSFRRARFSSGKLEQSLRANQANRIYDRLRIRNRPGDKSAKYSRRLLRRRPPTRRARLSNRINTKNLSPFEVYIKEHIGRASRECSIPLKIRYRLQRLTRTVVFAGVLPTDNKAGANNREPVLRPPTELLSAIERFTPKVQGDLKEALATNFLRLRRLLHYQPGDRIASMLFVIDLADMIRSTHVTRRICINGLTMRRSLAPRLNPLSSQITSSDSKSKPGRVRKAGAKAILLRCRLKGSWTGSWP